MVSRLDQPVPELPVADLERATDYYRDCLGFEEAWRHGDMVGMAREGVAIFLRKSLEPVPRSTHWMFAVDIDGAFQELRELGARIVAPPEDKPWGMRQFTIEDPDEHRFHVHHDL